jgi:hypothetical protein
VDDASIPVNEDARRRFESAWAEGRPEPIEKHLPDEKDPSFPGTLLELVLIDLELRWRRHSGENEPTRPCIEDYLARFPSLKAKSLLRRLIEGEYTLRCQFGEKPGPEDFRARFPEVDWTRIEFETLVSPRVPGMPELPVVPGLEILSLLGRGGMGIVYKARQLALDRIVAVKQIIPRAGGLCDEDLSRFQIEAQAIGKLHHPHVVQVYEVGETQGAPYLLLEFIDGGTLTQRLQGKPQPARWSAEVIRDVAGAVQAVHESGLLHRDLKPGNILLTTAGTPKITDFGLTKRLEDSSAGLTQSGAIVGTPMYMAPEQAAGKTRELSPAIDIYALGAILYEMLTGRPPFQGETTMDTVFQVVHGDTIAPRRFRANIPRDLETICLKCLQKDRTRRYASAGAGTNVPAVRRGRWAGPGSAHRRESV